MKHLKLIASISLLLFLGMTITSCDSAKDDKAKYIFLFIGDGMGFSHVGVTESYLSYKQGKLGGEQLTLTTFPVHGSAFSHSANYPVTDSSAGATAIATGTKTNNKMLCMDPDGNKLKSMSYYLQEDGYNVGVISSVPINHATPASFYAKNASRYIYYDITAEIPDSGFDFFAGSGMMEFFGKEGDKRSSAECLEEKGVNVCYSIKETEEAIEKGERILLCQPYNQDKNPSNYETTGVMPEGHIYLSEMLELGLKRLGDKDPFFIMCEGGEIDWAGHRNKTMPLINAVLEFDKAIAIAYEFYKKHPEQTLIVITADHATGGIALNSQPDWERMEETWIKDGYSNTLDKKANQKLNDKCNIEWTTRGHTGEPVPVYAIGKGAEKFGGRMDNTGFISRILGEDYKDE